MQSKDFGRWESSAEPVVGALIGLRTFRVGDDGVLVPASDVNPAPWTPGENIATCPMMGGPDHRIPGEGCSCGIYAYGSLSAAEASHYGHASHVLAFVEGYGKVRYGDLGYRAERARIVSVWMAEVIPESVRNKVAERYGVPVTTNRQEFLDGHTPTRLPEQGEGDFDGPSWTKRATRVGSVVLMILSILSGALVAAFGLSRGALYLLPGGSGASVLIFLASLGMLGMLFRTPGRTVGPLFMSFLEPAGRFQMLLLAGPFLWLLFGTSIGASIAVRGDTENPIPWTLAIVPSAMALRMAWDVWRISGGNSRARSRSNQWRETVIKGRTEAEQVLVGDLGWRLADPGVRLADDLLISALRREKDVLLLIQTTDVVSIEDLVARLPARIQAEAHDEEGGLEQWIRSHAQPGGRLVVAASTIPDLLHVLGWVEVPDGKSIMLGEVLKKGSRQPLVFMLGDIWRRARLPEKVWVPSTLRMSASQMLAGVGRGVPVYHQNVFGDLGIYEDPDKETAQLRALDIVQKRWFRAAKTEIAKVGIDPAAYPALDLSGQFDPDAVERGWQQLFETPVRRGAMLETSRTSAPTIVTSPVAGLYYAARQELPPGAVLRWRTIKPENFRGVPQGLHEQPILAHSILFHVLAHEVAFDEDFDTLVDDMAIYSTWVVNGEAVLPLQDKRGNVLAVLVGTIPKPDEGEPINDEGGLDVS